MTAPDVAAAPGCPASRDDFPHSLQAYATPEGAADAGGWILSLYRAVGPEERAWLHAHGFTLSGRLWIRSPAKNG